MPASPTTLKLVQIPIFRGLTEAEAKGVLEIAEERSFAKEDFLFHEGEAGDSLCVILEGHVEVLKRDRQGALRQLALIGDGGVLGEMSLISGNAPRSASARTLTPVRLLRVPSAKFVRLIHTESLGALKVVHNLAQVMSRRLLMMDEKLVDLLDRSPKKEELAEFHKILSDWSF